MIWHSWIYQTENVKCFYVSQSNRSSLFSVSIMYVDPNCRPFSNHCFKWETSSAPCRKKVVCTVCNFALYPPKRSYVKNLWLSIGNSMICSDIWHKYHEWYFEIVIQNFASRYRRVKFVTIWKYHEWYICQMSRTNHAIICLYYYPQKLCNFHM